MSNFQRNMQKNDENRENTGHRPRARVERASAFGLRPKIRCGPGISCERAVVVCLKYTRLSADQLCDRLVVCVGGIPQSYWAVAWQATLGDVIYCYSAYTSTLFCFRHCTLFRLYVYVVPFPSMYVIPFIRQR